MKDEEKIALGERVRKAREAKGLTQLQLAEGICSDGTVSQLERGKLIPKARILQSLCDKLGISTKDLLKDHEENMEVDTLLEIIKIHIEKSEFEEAFYLIGTLKKRTDLAEYQKRNFQLTEANGLIKTGKSQEAIEILKPLLKRLDDTDESDHHLVANVLNQLGNANFRIHRLVEAYLYYKQAYRTSDKFHEFDLLAADITFNLGNICTWLGYDTEALGFVSLAKEYFEKVSDTRGVADALFSLGISYHDLNEWEKSKASLQQSLALYESINMVQTAEKVKHAYASLVLRQTAPKEAIQIYLHTANKYAQQQDHSRLVHTYALVAMTYIDLQEFDQAKLYLDMAMNFIDPKKQYQDPRFVSVFRVHGIYFFRIKAYEQALQYSTKAAELYDMIGLQRDAVECLKICMDIYHETGCKDDEIRVSREIIKKFEHDRTKPYFRQEV